jgi:hypothetical protein
MGVRKKIIPERRVNSESSCISDYNHQETIIHKKRKEKAHIDELSLMF